MKRKHILILSLIAAVLTIGGIFAFRQYAYREAHVWIEGTAYPKDLQTLDLRGKEISIVQYEAFREALPECDILWDVPFQGTSISNDTAVLTVSNLSEADLAMLPYFPQLTTIDAEDCRDYAILEALQHTYPALDVRYRIFLNGKYVPLDTHSLTFTETDPGELMECFQYLHQLSSVHFIQPCFPAETLLALRDAYPSISFTWEKDLLGTTYTQDITQLDFSNTPLEDVTELEEVCAYFPNLEKLILCHCGLDNETLAAYRDRVREHYKVVWSVKIGFVNVRTDETTFMPIKHGLAVQNGHMKDFVYCEDMICVDLGHMNVKDIDWIYGMPHLQFLVLVESKVEDITPIGSLKELIYLELFKCPGITDYSPLVNCTALQDVNMAYTNGDAAVFSQMPWLKHLWVNCTRVSPETRQLLTETLPDTVIEFDSGWHMGNGWRDLDNYYVMRDLLEMPYYDWGSKRLTEKE